MENIANSANIANIDKMKELKEMKKSRSVIYSKSNGWITKNQGPDEE